jgi:dolichyl-phosphate-mannose--protein O-mannosyl transferase
VLPKPSALDRWQSRMTADPRRARRVTVLAATAVTLLAGILRFANLGHPHSLVFDETYYVKDAWSEWVLGYASKWPEDEDAAEGDDTNSRFAAGETDIFTGEASFVVHPPLGKLLIGAGMALFGADSSFGWRVATALFGTALVLVLFLLAKTLTGSTVFATVAGLLVAVDGLAIVMSRVALLDIFVAFFVVLAFWFVALDRRRLGDRLAAALAARRPEAPDDAPPPSVGPLLWDRPWLLAAGVALGAATAVKWSGLYALAGVGLYAVISDALARRRLGIRHWAVDAALRQGPLSFLLLVPPAALIYLSSWFGWLSTDGGWKRQSAPTALESLWSYHQEIYRFHVTLTSDHSYASPAWQWPLLLRPTSMFYDQVDGGVQNIYSMPNPVIWWTGVVAVVWLGYRAIRGRDWRHALVLTGFAVTYLPWLLYPERTVFQFYTVVILPFLVLALTFALRDITRSPDPERRRTGQAAVWAFLVIVLAVSAFWYPILTAMTVPYEFWQAHNWLPSWV